MKIVITHHEMGIYLGNCMGLGFWSMLDSVGQDYAATFPSRSAAENHIKPWDENNEPENYSFVHVPCDGDYAPITALKAAGLSRLLGDMELNALTEGSLN